MSKRYVAAVILAAGSSSRFGRPKQLLAWDGQPLIIHAVDTAWAAELSPIIVVLGAFADEITPLLASREVQILKNYGWSDGISSSIRTGISALPDAVDAAIFMPADQPLLTPSFLQNLVSHYEATEKAIVVPHSADGEPGNPVLFDRRFFSELSQLSGDTGGKRLLSKYAGDIAKLPITNATILMDVDSPEALDRLWTYKTSQPALDLVKTQGIICDMDGVLWRGDESLEGLHDFFEFIHRQNLGYILATNNSSRTPAQYAHKLSQLGVEISENHILNSANAAAHYVANALPGATVYPIGGPGLMHALQHYGLKICDEDISKVDFVIVGWDQTLTWNKLAAATRLILDGAKFIGTNPDLTFPLETSLAPGNGAQLAALEAATNVKPIVIGKPEGLLYQQAMDRMGTTPKTTLVIGDRLDTDILGGVRLGLPTILVLTGISRQDALHNSPIRPSAVYENLPQLLDSWRQQVNRSDEL